MIKLLLLAIVPFMTEHRNVTPKTEVSTNFYGSVTGIVDNAYIQAHGGGGVDTNEVRDIAREEIVPATNRLNQTLSDALDDKRDKDNLNVYSRAFTGRENWTLRRNSEEYELEYVSEGYWKHDYTEPGYYDYIRIRNGTDFEYGENVGTGEHVMWYDDYNQLQEHPEYIDMSVIRTYVSRTPQGSMTPTSDRLATTNGVNAAMTNRYTKSETDAKLAGKLDSRAAERGSISWNVSQDDTASLNVSAISANFDGEIFVAGDSTFNGRVSCTYGWEGFESNGEILPVYLDSLEWRTTGNRSLADYGITDAAPLSMISEDDPTFSNAVLSVGLNIDTNSVAVLNDIAATFGGFPIGGTATTVGGLLAALAAAIAWLKKNKVQTLKLNNGSVVKTAENGVAKLDDFFTESNSLLTATIDAEVISKGTAPDAHLEAPTDEHLKLVLADNSVAYDSAKALPYKLTSVIGDRVIATMTLTAASTDITLPAISANDTTVKDFILDVTNAYAVEGVATDAGINIPRTDFKLVTRDGESLTDVTTVKAGKSAFICFTQKSPVVVDGTTYPCWCVIQLPFGDPS